jgi:hypothetical protein
MLFYEMIQHSKMTGEIIKYKDFLRRRNNCTRDFDIVMVACIGKDEIGSFVSPFCHFPFPIVTSEQMAPEHWEQMRQLEEQIPIWPSVAEQMRHYSKLQTEQDLAYIAEKITRTGRPKTVFNAPNSGDYFAKRNFSSDGRHAFHYQQGVTLPKEKHTTWFFQETNELLQSFGEIKIVIVNGHHFTIPILCKPDNDSDNMELTERITRAHMLSSM